MNDLLVIPSLAVQNLLVETGVWKILFDPVNKPNFVCQKLW